MSGRQKVEDVKPIVDTAPSSATYLDNTAMSGTPTDPMAKFRATSDPNVKELDNDQLELLLQRTNEARAAIAAELNRRGNN